MLGLSMHHYSHPPFTLHYQETAFIRGKVSVTMSKILTANNACNEKITNFKVQAASWSFYLITYLVMICSHASPDPMKHSISHTMTRTKVRALQS